MVLSDITVCITTAFGGVLVFGALDHSQIDAIDVSECAVFCIISRSFVYDAQQGLPFLLSSHILTDFTLVQLKHSGKQLDM